MFGALRKGAVDDLVLIGQCGQSIDGRIATPSGDSHYINGEAGLDHLHRLRSLVDAVVIGAGTAIADDPQLTVRRVAGANPARIVIDPQRRLPSTARALREDGIRRIVITARSGKTPVLPGVEIVPLAD
ncbi:MAG TPA: dihydrofolate reductase family protein, partial [Xanthobacteraceae bacterium]